MYRFHEGPTLGENIFAVCALSHRAPVATRQAFEQPGVEDKHAMHRRMQAQRVMQGGVVVHAQIATEPDEGGGHGMIERGYSGTD